MEKWLKKWEETGVIQNLPTNKGTGIYKAFLLLMCRETPKDFYTGGIVGLDDNLKPKGLSDIVKTIGSTPIWQLKKMILTLKN